MAKELPYFQFEPAEYLTKDVSFCSLSAQGLFINICSYYWQRQCDLSKEQFLRRFNYENEFNELIKEGVIDLIESKIVIKFLLSQYLKATEKSTVNSSNGAKGGRPKNQIKSEIKANENPIKSETKGIREYNIIKENNINENFYKELLISESWIEINAKNNRISPEKTKQYLTKFDNKLKAENDVKVNKTEYCSHFARWLGIEVKKSVQEQIKKPPLL
jgi:hypothetical protein